jgi:superfamily II DNA/RNA helicase
MLSNSKSNFDNVKYLTLDEADKLLTFGFDEDLR